MTDQDKVLDVFDGRWAVIRHEKEGDGTRMYLRSEKDPGVTMSILITDGHLPPVGGIGKWFFHSPPVRA